MREPKSWPNQARLVAVGPAEATSAGGGGAAAVPVAVALGGKGDCVPPLLDPTCGEFSSASLAATVACAKIVAASTLGPVPVAAVVGMIREA